MKLPFPYEALTKRLDAYKSDTDSKHWWVLCPFHPDTNASMVINKNGKYAGYYKCFCCGAYGSPKAFAKWAGKNPNKVYFPEVKIPNAYVQIDWTKILNRAELNIGKGLKALCASIGISPDTVKSYRIGYDEEKFEFLIPMYNPRGDICGIQRRAIDGTKRSMAHSRQGVFIARRNLYFTDKTLFVGEGFSDSAITTEMGFQAIGRYNASQRLTEDLARHLRNFKLIVLVSDNDKVGTDGMKKWWERLRNSMIITPKKKYKDIRKQALEEGLDETRAYLEVYNG